MRNSNIRSPWAKFAFFALSVFWAVVGWYVLLQGGFHTTHKYTRETTYVDGAGAIVMAYIFLLLATVSSGVILESINARRSAYAALIFFFLVPPLILLCT